MSEQESGTQCAVCPTPALAVESVPALPLSNVDVVAENSDEMALAQSSLVEWFRAKLKLVRVEAAELRFAYQQAVERKWKSSTLQRHADLALKRVEFYEKVLGALEHGYQIVPSFPVTAFMIRTNRKNPLRMVTPNYWAKHTQEPEGLPTGEGAYKNPFPVVRQETLSPATQTQSEKVRYWAESWESVEFPVSMAAPRIIEATTRAMALKIFDDIGILPGHAPSEGTRAPRGDPVIVARIKQPKKYPAENVRWVTFIVAWRMNTSDFE